jgi:membrane protein implicated in regulation of membrane protease activity
VLDAFRLIFDWAELRAIGFDAVIYAAIAVVGTLLFLLRLLLGLFFDVEGMAEADVEIDSEGSAAFGIFSFLSVTAFLMTTGWVGLATRLDLQLAALPAAAISIASGAVMMCLTGFLMVAVRRLAQEQSYDLSTAVGRTGQVYMAIPEHGTGKVRVSVSGRSMIVDARSDGPALDAFTDVQVVEVRDDGVLIVTKST